MATKELTTYLAGAYTLSAAYSQLVVEPGAGAAGGVYSNHYAEVVNYGRLGSKDRVGVYLDAGGEVQNGIAGYTSARITLVEIESARGTVLNYGTISAYHGGVFLEDGGVVVNGGDTNTTALIAGLAGLQVEGATGTVQNYGRILGAGSHYAAYLDAGGTLANGSSGETSALIEGGGGVSITGVGTVTNFGTIMGADGSGLILAQGGVRNLGQILGVDDGVQLTGAGSVTNGSAANHLATITGYTGAELDGVGSITNFGTVISEGGGSSAYGVALRAGGGLANGQAGDLVALITGYTGVVISGGLGTVVNFGAIEGLGSTASGVTLAAGGVVANGSGTDTTALISGGWGVKVAGTAAGTVNNYGTVMGQGGAYYAGVAISGAARVFNALRGLIEGGDGVALAGGGVVHNDGTIRGQANVGVGGAGVLLSQGGVVYNGAASDRSALITGDYGVFSPVSSVVYNLGTISGAYRSAGVELAGGGGVANGSMRNAVALITGYDGVKLVGAASLANFGTVAGIGGYGVFLDGAGESVTNGAAGDARATISGYQGVEVYSGAVTVNNFGTISGDGGPALSVNPGGSVLLEVEAGSAFIGAVDGAGGTLDLASGAGTIVLAGSLATVAGSMAPTAFADFGTVRIAAGASFTVSGDNTGILSVVGGTLTSDGTVSGTGHVNIDTGIADLGAGFEEAVDFTGTTGELKLGSSKTYTGKITGFSKTGTTSLDLLDIAFAGTTTAHYSGTATSGVLTVTEGANTAKITLEGDYLSSTFTLSAAPGGGTLVVDPPKAAPADVISPAPPHGFIAAMAGFGAATVDPVAMTADVWHTPPPPMLATSRVRLA